MSFETTTVNAASASDLVTDWVPGWKGALVAAVQGVWGGATEIALVARFGGVDVPSGGKYARLATFKPDDDRGVEFVFGRSLPPLEFDFRWEVTDNDGSTDLQLIHGRG